jgi:hypothetical protein
MYIILLIILKNFSPICQFIVRINRSADMRSRKTYRQVLFFHLSGGWKVHYKIHQYRGVIMKDHEIKVLDEDDNNFIETLRNIGSCPQIIEQEL